MSNGTGDWYTEPAKNGAVWRVLDYVAVNPGEGLACVGKDDDARKFFERVGGITVPVDRGARVIFFAPGEKDLKIGSSVILEMPAAPMLNATDGQKQELIIAQYTYWRPPKK